MVKTEHTQPEDIEPTPGSAWLIGAAAWFIPGLGHVLTERWGRAALMGGSVWLAFFLGLAMGGHLYAPSAAEFWAALLQVPPMVADIGAGAPYIVSWLLDIGFGDDPHQAARATYEYGNHLLLIAGLMNYLVMLDAFDIAAGRKS